MFIANTQKQEAKLSLGWPINRTASHWTRPIHYNTMH